MALAVIPYNLSHWVHLHARLPETMEIRNNFSEASKDSGTKHFGKKVPLCLIPSRGTVAVKRKEVLTIRYFCLFPVDKESQHQKSFNSISMMSGYGF